MRAGTIAAPVLSAPETLLSGPAETLFNAVAAHRPTPPGQKARAVGGQGGDPQDKKLRQQRRGRVGEPGERGAGKDEAKGVAREVTTPSRNRRTAPGRRHGGEVFARVFRARLQTSETIEPVMFQ